MTQRDTPSPCVIFLSAPHPSHKSYLSHKSHKSPCIFTPDKTSAPLREISSGRADAKISVVAYTPVLPGMPEGLTALTM